jgi:hypothetical protein
MMAGHGWVTPRPDGARACCGGPARCRVCAQELEAQQSLERIKEATDEALAGMEFTELSGPMLAFYLQAELPGWEIGDSHFDPESHIWRVQVTPPVAIHMTVENPPEEGT